MARVNQYGAGIGTKDRFGSPGLRFRVIYNVLQDRGLFELVSTPLGINFFRIKI